MKEIREKQERDRAAWLKKMGTVLDKLLTEMEGKTYFYQITQEQIAETVKRSGIVPAQSSAEKEKSKETDKEKKV